MKLGKVICHLSTVMYCNAKTGADEVMKWNIMHFDKQQFLGKKDSLCSGCLVLFFTVLKSYFGKVYRSQLKQCTRTARF